MLLLIFLFATVGLRLIAGTCTTSTWQYDTPFTGYSAEDTGTATGSGYLMESPEYHVPNDCSCGVLYKWHFYATSAGAIQFQVWDRVANQQYVLKGENFFTIPASALNTEIEFFVPIKDRITVRNNYLIGWFALNNGKIGYKTAATYPNENRIDVGIGDLVTGDTYDWTSGTSTEQLLKVYAIGASVTANTAPDFTNLPRTVNIYRTWTAASVLYTVEVDDLDEQDVSLLLIHNAADPTGYFNFSTTTREVSLKQSYPAEGTYTLQFIVSDQCGNTNTRTLTIVVFNWAPSLTNLPAFATVTENYDHEVALHTVTFSDADDTTLTSILNINPSTSNIELKNIGLDTSNLAIVTKSSSSYAYSTAQFYLLDLTLTDGTTSTDTGYFMVYVTKNDPPRIHNLNHAATVNVSYITTAHGAVVYSVNVTDAENDPLTFSMVCDPVGCPFVIDSDGVIYTSSDMIRLYVPGYDIVVTVTDGTTTVASKTLTVLVQDINYQPDINNLALNRRLVLYENTALGTVIFTVRYNDLDSTDTHLFEATFSTEWAPNYIQIDSTTGEVKYATTIIDYEMLGGYFNRMDITLSDGEDWETINLNMIILNVNEPPAFHQTKYTLEAPEEGTAGLSAGSTGFVVEDQDLLVAANNEAHFYTWDCGIYSRYFIMDYTTGAVTFATTFDYDTANVTVPYSCTVTVTDVGGLSATTVLEIDIQDANDNGPVFTQTADYLIFQVSSLPVSRFVGQVRATDSDRSDKYNAIYYNIISSTPTLSNGYLYINNYGNIYVNETWTSPEFDQGVSYELVIQAENVEDETGTKRTATATATLIIPGTSTVSTTTTDRPAYFIKDDTRNVAWVAVASALAVVLLCIVCCLFLHYTIQTKRYRWCMPMIRKRLLGLKERTLRQKQQYYRQILIHEELNRSSSESDDAWFSDDDDYPDEDDHDQPLIWTNVTFKKGNVPAPATYHEPRPPKKNATSSV